MCVCVVLGGNEGELMAVVYPPSGESNNTHTLSHEQIELTAGLIPSVGLSFFGEFRIKFV